VVGLPGRGRRQGCCESGRNPELGELEEKRVVHPLYPSLKLRRSSPVKGNENTEQTSELFREKCDSHKPLHEGGDTSPRKWSEEELKSMTYSEERGSKQLRNSQPAGAGAASLF